MRTQWGNLQPKPQIKKPSQEFKKTHQNTNEIEQIRKKMVNFQYQPTKKLIKLKADKSKTEDWPKEELVNDNSSSSSLATLFCKDAAGNGLRRDAMIDRAKMDGSTQSWNYFSFFSPPFFLCLLVIIICDP